VTVLGPDGKPVPEPDEARSCPACGSDRLEKSESFGGYFKLVCRGCGNVLSQGRTT
jgi:hypothetical protein